MFGGERRGPFIFFYCQLNQVASAQGLLLVRAATLNTHHWLWQEFSRTQGHRAVGSKAKTSSPPEKAFSAALCSSFKVKIASSDKTGTNAASTLGYLAAARLADTSCVSSFSSGAFKSSLQRLLPSFVTTKKKLIEDHGLVFFLFFFYNWKDVFCTQTSSVRDKCVLVAGMSFFSPPSSLCCEPASRQELDQSAPVSIRMLNVSFLKILLPAHHAECCRHEPEPDSAPSNYNRFKMVSKCYVRQFMGEPSLPLAQKQEALGRIYSEEPVFA